MLAIYRLLLAGLLIALYLLGFAQAFLEELRSAGFFRISLTYGVVAALLLPPIIRRAPGLRMQAHANFAADTLILVALLFAAKGVGSGFGVLLVAPMLGCGLLLGLREALTHAAAATLLLLLEEFVRQSVSGFDAGVTTESGLLGLMLFGTVIAGSAAAHRARRGEARAEQAGIDLANLAELNQRIIESMETGVLVVDADRRVRLLNLAAERLLGVSGNGEGALLGLRYPGVAAALARWQQNPALGGEAVAPWRGGQPVIPRFTRLSEDKAAPLLILLDDAARAGEEAQRIKLAALGRLSASIAHEIRNPLSAIHHAGQLLAESAELGTQDRRLLDMILRHSTRIDRIVQDVTNLSRSDAMAPALLDLRDFLQRTLALYRETHPGETRRIELEEVTAGLAVRFDPNHLQQILHNLWDNSFAHGASARPVTVRLRAHRVPPRPQVFLEIADDGRGIDAPLTERIFEPFFTTARPAAASGSGPGTGLGLYLARELCEYNHARLDYVPTKAGACFRLSFAA